MMEVGKLYICEVNLMIYPVMGAAAYFTESGISNAEYSVRRSGRDFVYVECGTPILALNSDGKYCEVLAGECKGWIRYESWLDLEEIT
ncbi:MAG: hypothetical protein FJY85_00780 [Deltaproteobacteria bacterium]|nr:hypothetical protein [Deltaproteobacteria bacterium]